MNHRLVLIGLAALVTVLGCQGTDSQVLAQSLEGRDYVLDRSQVVLRVPPSYATRTIEEYQQMMMAAMLPDELIASQIETLMHLEAQPETIAFFIDTVTAEAFMSVMESEMYIPLTKEIATLAVNMMADTQSPSTDLVTGQTVQENRFVQRKGIKYVKMKYKQDYFKGTRYVTHYLISTQTRSLAISVTDPKANDLQDYIDATRIKKKIRQPTPATR